MIARPPHRRPNRVLSLTIDRKVLCGSVVRQSGNSIESIQSFRASLAVDPLASDAELSAREIRQHLEAAGIHEKRCLLNLPPEWVMTLLSELPPIPPEDLPDFVTTEAERGFPYPPEALRIAVSTTSAVGPARWAMIAAVPKEKVERLELVLSKAGLSCLSISLAHPAVHSPSAPDAQGTLSLLPGLSGVSVQAVAADAIISLRYLQDPLPESSEAPGHPNLSAARELRVTLAQLPVPLSDPIRTIRVFRDSNRGPAWWNEFLPPIEDLGLRLQICEEAKPDGLLLPPLNSGIPLARSFLSRQPIPLEFLAPRISPWQKFGNRLATKRVAYAAALAVGTVLVTGTLFAVQYAELTSLKNQWAKISPRVTELESLQAKLRQYRPWFDESFPALHILKQVTDAFPEEGVVTAKSLEVRENGLVTCKGTAQTTQAIMAVREKLRDCPRITELQTEQLKGASPIQFEITFRWVDTPPSLP